MHRMFAGADVFDQNLGNWDIGSIIDSGFQTGMRDMFATGGGLSTANYDATLIGWSTDSSGNTTDGIDDIPTGIIFQGGSSTYCNGANARNELDTTYSWTISDAGMDCSDLGIDDNDFSASLMLYPNPSRNMFYIKGLSEQAVIDIYDMNGRLLIRQDNYLDTPINVSHLDAAIYFVNISNTRGKTAKRLVKQ